MNDVLTVSPVKGNFYRARYQNWLDEQHLAASSKPAIVHCPTLYLHPTKDVVFTDKMLSPMKALLPKLKVEAIVAEHWAHVEKPLETNEILYRWLAEEGLASDGDS